MEQYGNEYFNLERVLRENIVGHEYMRRTAREMNTWEEVIDEVYRAVDHVEPWMSGNVRGPSTAFCLMVRLCELKITEEQVHETITCKDSPYIRAVGFLYLRYVCMPHMLRDWLKPYLADRQKFHPSGESYGTEVTMGQFVCDLILSQTYFETIFTRLPKKYQDELIADMKELGLPIEPAGNGGQGGPERRAGDDGRGRPQSVKASLSVAMGQRAPNRAGVMEDSTRRKRLRVSDDGQAEEVAPRGSQGGEDKGHWRARGIGREREAGARGPAGRDAEGSSYRDPMGRIAYGNGYSTHERRRASPQGERRRRDERGAHGDGGARASSRLGARDSDGRREHARGPERARGVEWDWDRSRGRAHTPARRAEGDRRTDRGTDAPKRSGNVFGRSADDVFGKPATGQATALSNGWHSAADHTAALASSDPDAGVVRIGRRR